EIRHLVLDPGGAALHPGLALCRPHLDGGADHPNRLHLLLGLSGNPGLRAGADAGAGGHGRRHLLRFRLRHRRHRRRGTGRAGRRRRHRLRLLAVLLPAVGRAADRVPAHDAPALEAGWHGAPGLAMPLAPHEAKVRAAMASQSPKSPIDPVKLDKLAEVAIKVGLQLQPGQDLVLTAPVAALPLVRRIAAHAYKAGAGLVSPIFSDEEITLARYRHAPDA